MAARPHPFAQGPPDTSGLSREETLRVMREYRRWKEQPRAFDFSAGPPDVSALSRDESLRVLREYRQWRTECEQASAAPASPAAGMPAAGFLGGEQQEVEVTPVPPPAQDELQAATYGEAVAPAMEGAAGVASTQRVTQHGYFERPVTARAEAVRGLETEPAGQAPVASTPRVWSAEGCAGLHSTQRPPSSHAWIEQTVSRPTTAARTDERVFAPLPSADEVGPHGNRMRAEAQRLERQRELDAAALTQRAALDAPRPVAGCATALNETSTAALMAPLAGAPQPAAPPRPVEAKAPPPSKLEWHVGGGEAPPAGMSTAVEGARTTARGMVEAPDSRQAAQYNLQVKQLAGGVAPTPAGLAPWAGGGERLQAQLATASPRRASADYEFVAAQLPLSATLHGAPPTAGLSPRERLVRLKGLA